MPVEYIPEVQPHMTTMQAAPANRLLNHLRYVHEWAVYEHEEDDVEMLRAMHRCAHEDDEAEGVAR